MYVNIVHAIQVKVIFRVTFIQKINKYKIKIQNYYMRATFIMLFF